MKLMEGFQTLRGAPAVILNCHRFGLPEFFVEMGYKVGAEIGVYKGEFTERFCKAGMRMYAVDPWIAYSEQQSQDRQDFIHDHARRLLAPYDCMILRKISMDALADIRDNSLDFVYIDGDHSFKEIAADIVEWEKKVVRGGIVSGHDYFNSDRKVHRVECQVKAVVDAYTRAFKVDNWWVFGELDPDKEPNRKERFLSWMWLKQ